jgi:hypothetical protein
MKHQNVENFMNQSLEATSPSHKIAGQIIKVHVEKTLKKIKLRIIGMEVN